jgi:hypothetical protein
MPPNEPSEEEENPRTVVQKIKMVANNLTGTAIIFFSLVCLE